MATNAKIFISIIGISIIGLITTAFLRGNSAPEGPGKYDAFATCLKDKGATFYGAFWCPHCQAQKKLFGSSVKFLPYVECSTVDGSGQTQVCKDKGVTSYPTWEFSDMSRLTGEISLQQLADKTSCILPDGQTTTAPVDTGASSPAAQ